MEKKRNATRAPNLNICVKTLPNSKRSTRVHAEDYIRKIVQHKRSQVGVEYMIVIGFVTFAIITILALSFFYSNEIKDKIKLNQVESFADNLINSAESVFFAGEPSKTTINLYLPDGVESIVISTDAVIITTRLGGGSKDIRAFESNVPLTGTITPTEGTKKLTIEARLNDVSITQG